MTAPLRVGSLFSGCGGLDEGVNAVIGGDTVWHAEHYAPSRRVLAHNYPDVPQLGDIAAVDWDDIARSLPIDVLTAGFPCQKLSLLGTRAGLNPTAAADELFAAPSGWELTTRAIRATRPALVVLENVSALLNAPECDGGAPGTAFLAVLRDLAELGLDAEWVCADAGAAGAAHRRRRIFIAAADPERFRRGAWRDRHEQGQPARFRWDDPAGGAVRVDGPPEPVWGKHAGAIARAEQLVGRRAPHPVLMRARNHHLWEWLMGLPAGWLTGAGVAPAEVIRIAGNGVVPQQVAMALPTLLERLAPARAALPGQVAA